MEDERLILDTTAVSAFFRGNEEVNGHIVSADELYLSPVVIGELLAGFGMGKHEEKNREILRALLSSVRVRTVDIDVGTSERYGAILTYLRETGSPTPTHEIWIAASAMQHGLKLLTTDKRYAKIPQVISILCAAEAA
jgi:tRNA(fMet)-specific endonuclease VapC